MFFDGNTTATYTYAYNNFNQLTSRGDGGTTTVYSYDANGNLTEKGDGATTYAYSWTYEDKMDRVSERLKQVGKPQDSSCIRRTKQERFDFPGEP